jgi:cysteine desulfurase
VTRSLINLDLQATTPLDPLVAADMFAVWSEGLGNASNSTHALGRRAADVADAAVEELAQAFSAHPREVVFTSGATEANNLAIQGVLRAAGSGSHVVLSAVEHPSVWKVVERCVRQGAQATVVPVDQAGRVDPAAIAAAITPQTRLVSVMWANHEIGTIQPVREIGELCRRRNVWFHTDATQAVPRLPIVWDDLPIDLLSFSAHKCYGPCGVGGLLVRRSTPRIPLEPLLVGGGQQRGWRPGSLPVALWAGCARAVQLAQRSVLDEGPRLTGLIEQLWSQLTAALPDLHWNGPPLAERLPGTLHFSVAGVDGAALLAGLTHVICSAGAACSATSGQLSPVLQAIHLPEHLAQASLRIAAGRITTATDIDLAAAELIALIQRLREEHGRVLSSRSVQSSSVVYDSYSS